MIHNTLVCHPSASCSAVQSLSVELVILPGKGLHLSYHLQGDMQGLHIPDPQTPTMADGLWECTCFEAFIATEGEKGYQEFNFAPSGQWAVYRFDDYRKRRVWQSHHSYKINVTATDDDLILDVAIPLADLPVITTYKSILLGLTAVIAAADGSRSYWALHHATDTPDFHHRASFICTLEPNSF